MQRNRSIFSLLSNSFLVAPLRCQRLFQCRHICSVSERRQRRLELFEAENRRQIKNKRKYENMLVAVDLRDKTNVQLMMKHNQSTPYHCAMHVSETLCQRSAVAVVNGDAHPMHMPLSGLDKDKDGNDYYCALDFVFFNDQDPSHANKAYWRSCSFILGAVMETAFKDQFQVELLSSTGSNYRTGSFAYDVRIMGLPNVWTPKHQELNILSQLANARLKTFDQSFEPIIVDIDVAEKIFAADPLKLYQLSKLREEYNTVHVYRCGDHVDICSTLININGDASDSDMYDDFDLSQEEPLISTTSQFGPFSITAIHHIEGPWYRVQGVSVPFTQQINSYTWQIVSNASKPMNEFPLPYFADILECSNEIELNESTTNSDIN